MDTKSRIGRPTGFFFRVPLLTGSTLSDLTNPTQPKLGILLSFQFSKFSISGTEGSVTRRQAVSPPSLPATALFTIIPLTQFAILVKWPKAIDYILLYLNL
ncbi:hypothetical protein MA16_Dca023739 [Dendrobium catenatum]|uniref:Uncharacterized protein n=1 Tax=Dendrobium catenatum TaxID=906689 RepID=A0A2I0VAZ6_9ASPA|nr:hypothetical protein MA16_Dca023739 [Dendrobium catenatum]